MEISILVLDKNLSQTYLGTVIELAKRNSATLGFMPEGAFYQQAIQKRILIALTPEDRCVGYLLYREVKTQRKASITHLCIDERYRQHGYARELVRKLKQITSHLRGISLYSRRDYSSNTFWPNNGFIYQGEKPGRGKDKIPLSYYWFEQPNHTDLFSWLNQKQLNTKDIKAVIDANLFFDLSGAKNPPHTEKEIIAQSLLANWLQDEILLCVTPEIYNEINRREHPQERKRNKSFADQFPKIFDSRTEGTYDSVEQQVRQNFFPQELSISDRSDLRQLTYAILGQAKFFITNDGRLVDQVGEGIFDMFGLTVIRPSDFIIHFDEIVREVDYQPARLAGTRILINKTSSGQDEVLANLFQITAHETKPQFLSSLRRYLSNPLEFQVLVVAEPNKDPVALIVYSIKAHNRVEIPLFRVRKHTLSGTIASHLVLNAISYANQNDAQLIRVTERYLEGEIVDALRAHYFVQINQQ
ncbi:MAG TPA: GNAT family N-acetyltransferase, partial [Anaerolineales bacterium]|nr:GNAT family N-acetyltransferase [Anaerolineales bacterium]